MPSPESTNMQKLKWFAPILLGIFLVFTWFLVTHYGLVSEYFLPRPETVIGNLITNFSGVLAPALLQTLQETLAGCLFAVIVGIPLGFAIAHSKIISLSIEPYLAASQAIPAIAIAPLLVIWLGYGTFSIVVLCAIMVIFPIVINTSIGVRGIDSDLINAMKIDGGDTKTLLFFLEIPLAAPYMLAGLRNGFTLAITGAVVGEMIIGGQNGLGIELISAQHNNDTSLMFAIILLLVMVAVGIYFIIRTFESNLNRWVK